MAAENNKSAPSASGVGDSLSSLVSSFDLKKVQDLMNSEGAQEVKKTLQPVWQVVVDSSVVAKNKVEKAWETREERVKKFEAWRQKMASKTFDQHMEDFRRSMESRMNTTTQYVSSTPVAQQLRYYRDSTVHAVGSGVRYTSQKFTEFEQFSGTALPAPDPRIAELRTSLQKQRAACSAELQSIQSVVKEKEAKLAEVTKGYETKGLEAARIHGDMMQFKFLVKDIASAAVEHQEQLDEVIEQDMKQYLYQAKENAAHMAITVSTVEGIHSGQPFHHSLTGMLSFEHVSTLPFPVLDPSSMPSVISKHRGKGLSTKADLQNNLKKICEASGNLRMYLPRGALLGDLLSRVINPTNEDTVSTCASLQEKLWQGNLPEVRDRLKRWQDACESASAEVTSQVSPSQRREFVSKLAEFRLALDGYIVAEEFQRYLKARVQAHQKAFV